MAAAFVLLQRTVWTGSFLGAHTHLRVPNCLRLVADFELFKSSKRADFLSMSICGIRTRLECTQHSCTWSACLIRQLQMNNYNCPSSISSQSVRWSYRRLVRKFVRRTEHRPGAANEWVAIPNDRQRFVAAYSVPFRRKAFAGRLRFQWNSLSKLNSVSRLCPFKDCRAEEARSQNFLFLF